MGKVFRKIRKFLRTGEEDLSGKLVAITGATAGVGRAAAWEFAKQGARLALIARGTEALEATRREVEALGGEANIYAADVADAGRLEETVAAIEAEMGAIDIWVNNAMNSVFSPVKKWSPESIKG